MLEVFLVWMILIYSYYRTIPEVISCFEPLLEDLLACTDDLPVGINLFRELKKELVDHYCIRDGIILAGKLFLSENCC